MFLGIKTMRWTVEAYREEVDGGWDDIVAQEGKHLAEDDRTASGIGELIGWLKAVAAGQATPRHEPEIEQDRQRLRYRAVGGAVMIFVLKTPDTLLVLLFGKSASAHPTVAALKTAARRLHQWRP
jgi:hypothetical protein